MESRFETRNKEEQNNATLITDNSGYGDANFLQYRLNTDPLLADLELYLRGLRTKVVEDEDGNPQIVQEKYGRKKTNELGVQSIMAYVQAMVNPMVVQGNLSEEAYNNYLARRRKALSKHLMVNLVNFEIDFNEYEGIIDTIFATVELFITRPINNQERKTLMPGGHRYTEGFGGINQSTPVEKKKSLFNMF